MQTNPMQKFNRELADELVGILRKSPYIHVGSIEPDAERLPVPAYVLRAVIEALDLSTQQLTLYRGMTRDLAVVLRDMLATDPNLASIPIVAAAQRILTKVEEFNAE